MSSHHFKAGLPFSRWLQAGIIGLALALPAFSASSDPFEPEKFFQNAIALSAFSIAVTVLDDCDGPLVYTQQKQSEGSEQFLGVNIVCEQFPDDQGKMQRAAVKLYFDLSKEGEISGAPSIEYELP